MQKFKKFGKQLEGTMLEKLANDQVSKRLNLSFLQKVIQDLKGISVVATAANRLMDRFILLIANLPHLLNKVAKRSGGKLLHLFPIYNRADANLLLYGKALGELEEIVKAEIFRGLLKRPENFRAAEKGAQVLIQKLTTQDIDMYSSLKKKTTVYNALIEQLYPEDFDSLRIDAHHIIEDRTYEKFKETWKLIGWNSPDDMSAIPLIYRYHIRTPKNLPGLKKLAQKNDYVSLTTELLRNIKIEKIKTPEELIDAYRKYYMNSAIWIDVKWVLDAVEREVLFAKRKLKIK